MINHKGVSKEVQWINIQGIRALSNVLTTGKCILCLGIDFVNLRNVLPCFLPPLIDKGRAPATIYVTRIIRQLYSGTIQDSFIFCQDPVGKGITTMLCRDNPVATLLLGARKILLCIIVVSRVPEYVVHKLYDVRGGDKGNLIIRAVYMGRFSHTVIPQPNKKGNTATYIWEHHFCQLWCLCPYYILGFAVKQGSVVGDAAYYLCRIYCTCT